MAIHLLIIFKSLFLVEVLSYRDRRPNQARYCRTNVCRITISQHPPTLRVSTRLALPPYNMDDMDAQPDCPERATDEMEE